MNQVVISGETILLDDCRRLDQFPAVHPGLDGLGDVVECLLGSGMKLFIELGGLGLDGKAAQYLARVVPPRRGQLAEYEVAGLDRAARVILTRHAAVRGRHRGRADEMDADRAAYADIRSLDHVAEFMLAHADLGARNKGAHAEIGKRAADAHPLYLLLGLDEPKL